MDKALNGSVNLEVFHSLPVFNLFERTRSLANQIGWYHCRMIRGARLYLSVTFFSPVLRFLGSSGQGVTNIFRYTTHDDRLAILEQTLRYCHILPTAPDTLGCYPFYKSDPFIIKECPSVFFAGNQDKFDYTHLVGRFLLLLRLRLFLLHL